MAMTTQEKRDSIDTICRDEELADAYHYLDITLDWPLDSAFEKMVLLDELKKRMKDDVTHFSFRKKDGSVRQAYGTRLQEIVDRHEKPASPSVQKSKKKPARGTFTYFDIERRAWRSFKVDSIMDIDRGYTI